MKWALAVLLGAPIAASGAIAYSQFKHPAGDYSLEYPAHWKTFPGLQALGLRPPGKRGADVRVTFELYPIGRKSPQTSAAFIDDLLKAAKGLKKLESRKTLTVAGKPAQRLALTETVALPGEYGQTLPGPIREIYLVIDLKEEYYVLKLAGLGEAFETARPEFERIAESLKFKPR